MRGKIMKKILLWCITGLLICGLALPVAASTPIKLFINGKQSAIESLLINGKTYVPARFVSESLGAKVDYTDGVVKISTKEDSNPGGLSDDVPKKRTGEKVEIGDMSYVIE